MVSEFGLCVSECRELMSKLHNVDLCFIKRSANRVTYHLARASWLNVGHSYSADNVPGDLVDILIHDLVN